MSEERIVIVRLKADASDVVSETEILGNALEGLDQSGDEVNLTLEQMREELKLMNKQLEQTTVGTKAFNDLKLSAEKLKNEIEELVAPTKTLNQQLAKLEDELRNLSKIDAVEKAKKAFIELDKIVDENILSIQELGMAADNYKNIALAAGTSSPIGQSALEKAAAMERQMDQLNRAVTAVTEGGQRLNAALQLGTAVTAGFAAYQGIAALVGKDNEKLQETFVKLQAAQAALMGLKELSIALDKKGLLMTKAETVGTIALTAAKSLFNIVVGKSTGILKLFRIALASLGIGALIVGIGLLIANFETVQKWLQKLIGLLDIFSEAIIRVGEFFGLVEKGTSKAIEAERKQREQRKAADAELKQQHAARMKEISEQLKATIDASNSKIDALKLEKDTLEANGKNSAKINLQILEEQMAQTQAVLNANMERLSSWIEYYRAQAALRGQNDEEFKKSMLAQGVDLDTLQVKFLEIIEKNGNAVKYAENAITKFNREEKERRNKDNKKAADKDLEIIMKFQADAMNTWTAYHDKVKEELVIIDEDFYGELIDGLEAQAEESLKGFEKFIESVKAAFRDGMENIPDEFKQMLSDVSAGLDMAVETFGQVNEILNELGERRSQELSDRADRDLSVLEAQKQAELKQVGLSANQRTAIERRFAMAEYEIELKTAKQKDKIAENQFKREKAFRLVQIAMNTAASISQALASMPPPASFVFAGINAALGIAQAAIVASQKFQGSAASISPPSFSAPSADVGGDSGSGQSSGSSGAGGSSTGNVTVYPTPTIVISQVEINKSQENLARMDEVSFVG